MAVAAIEFLAEVIACVFRLQGRDKEGELDEQGKHEEHWSRVGAAASARRLALGRRRTVGASLARWRCRGDELAWEAWGG